MSKKVINNFIRKDDFNGGVYATNLEGKTIKWEDRGTSAFSYEFISAEIRKLTGQVLTVIDASISDERQLKAVKDLIRNHFADELNSLWETSEGSWQETVEGSLEEALKNGTLQEATLEEVLGA